MGAVVYEGTTRQGRYAFAVQFGTDNAAVLIANDLWSEVRNAARVRVEGHRIGNTHAALKDALLAVGADRLVG